MRQIHHLAMAGLLAASLIAEAGVWQSADAATELKFPHVGTPTSSYQWVAEKFSELVEKRTNGDIHITVIPGGQMGDQQDLLAGLRLGTIDFYTNDVGTMAFQEAGKDFNVLWAPYLFRDMDHFHKFLKSDVYKQMVEDYESKSGIKVLGYLLDRSPRQITTRETPLRTVEDMNGLKIRVPQLQTFIPVFEAWGANPTIMPWVEAVNALRQETVDGQDNGIDLITAFKLWESQKYFIRTEHVLAGIVLFTSMRRWEQWSPELRQIMLDSAEETYDALNSKLWALEEKGVEEMKANGMTIIEPDLTAFRDIAVEQSRKLDGTLWRKGLLDAILAIK